MRITRGCKRSDTARMLWIVNLVMNHLVKSAHVASLPWLRTAMTVAAMQLQVGGVPQEAKHDTPSTSTTRYNDTCMAL